MHSRFIWNSATPSRTKDNKPPEVPHMHSHSVLLCRLKPVVPSCPKRQRQHHLDLQGWIYIIKLSITSILMISDPMVLEDPTQQFHVDVVKQWREYGTLQYPTKECLSLLSTLIRCNKLFYSVPKQYLVLPFMNSKQQECRCRQQ